MESPLYLLATQATLWADLHAALTRDESPDLVIPAWLASLQRHFAADVAQLWLLDAREQTLTLASSAAVVFSPAPAPPTTRLGQTWIERIAAERRPFLGALPASEAPGALAGADVATMAYGAGVPLCVADSVVGALALIAPRPLVETTLAILASVAPLLAQLITQLPADTALASHGVEARDGGVQGDASLWHEIVAVRQIGRALRESEARYRAITEDVLDNAHVGVCILDASFQIVWLNRAIERFFGARREQVIGQAKRALLTTHLQPIVTDGESVVQRLSATYHQNAAPDRFSIHVLPGSDRAERWLEYWSQPIHGGLYAGGRIEFYYDITARTQAEQALQRSEAHFRALVQNASDLVLLVDEGGIVRYASPALKQMLGIDPEQLAGQSVFVLVHRDDLAAAERAFGIVRDDVQATLSLTVRAPHADGSWRVLEAIGSNLRAHTGALGIVVNVRDITERARFEEALRQAMAEAEQANAAKSAFLSRTSHELRTPLNHILGFAQLLETGALTQDQRESVEYILAGGRQLLSMVDALLDIAQIDQGQLKLARSSVDAAALARSILEQLQPLAAQQGVHIALQAPSEATWLVEAEPERLRQALVHLITNAIRYNRPGGTVTIAGACGEAERVRLLVRDTGPGIPSAKLERLFQPFDRLDAEQSRVDVEGVGLGLALAQRLIQAMEGSIGVESVEGAGSTFWIELPTPAMPGADGSAAGAIAAVPQLDMPVEDGGREMKGSVAPNASRYQVLYIEDTHFNITLMEHILRQRNDIDLVIAMQGRLGLEQARANLPDVILLDLNLPDLRGEEIMGALRSDPRTQTIPVVIVSADATPRQIERLLAMGAQAYCTKPLDVPRFLRIIDTILRERRP